MFLGMIDQIRSNLSKSNHFCPNFVSILPKIHFVKRFTFIPCIPSSYGTSRYHVLKLQKNLIFKK